MTRESYLRKLILENGFTVKEFAQSINMPYSTLLTMLNDEKIGNAAVDNVIRICQGLNITIQDLQSVLNTDAAPAKHLVLSGHEEELIRSYRSKEDLQKAVDILLLSDRQSV